MYDDYFQNFNSKKHGTFGRLIFPHSIAASEFSNSFSWNCKTSVSSLTLSFAPKHNGLSAFPSSLCIVLLFRRLFKSPLVKEDVVRKRLSKGYKSTQGTNAYYHSFDIGPVTSSSCAFVRLGAADSRECHQSSSPFYSALFCSIFTEVRHLCLDPPSTDPALTSLDTAPRIGAGG